MTFDAKRTNVAQSAFDFSKYFSGIFDGVRVMGGSPRKPILAAPEGMSTEGGKRARQSLVLQPENPSAAVVIVGWVDIRERQAMMRTHEALATLHRERFGGRPFDVDPSSYAGFFDQARGFLQSCGFNVKVEAEASPGSMPVARIQETRSPNPSAASSTTLLYCFSAFFFGVVVGGLLVYARLVWLR